MPNQQQDYLDTARLRTYVKAWNHWDKKMGATAPAMSRRLGVYVALFVAIALLGVGAALI